MVAFLWVILAALPLLGQPGCPSTPIWTVCDLIFDLTPQENPAQAELHAEFRSPRHRTYLLHAFRDGDRRLVIRFAPTEAGAWEYRLTSNLARLDGQMGQGTAGESDAPGYVRFSFEDTAATENQQPHLWMATGIDRFMAMPRADFDRLVAQRAHEHFTHLRVTIEPGADLAEVAERIRAINARGLTADLGLASIPPDARERERYLGDVVARFAAFNITWAGTTPFEDLPHGRSLVKEAGALIQKLDPYGHPRTTMAASTSGALTGDGWMNLLSYGTPEVNTGEVEHQLFQLPAVNTGIQSQRDLWNATMNGQ